MLSSNSWILKKCKDIQYSKYFLLKHDLAKKFSSSNILTGKKAVILIIYRYPVKIESILS